MKSPARFTGIARLGAAALTAAVSVSACSLFRGKLQEPLKGPVFPMAVTIRIPYEGRVMPPVAYADGRVFFVTDLGHVHAVDVERKAPAWEFRAEHPVSQPVSLGQGRLYVVDDRMELSCLDREGRLVWRKELDESPAGPLVESDGRLYLGTEQGSLIAVRVEDGGEIWRFRAGQAVRTGALFWRDGRGTPFILCGGDEGVIYFLSLDGRSRGRMPCGGRLYLPPLLEKSRIYLSTDRDEFLCFNLKKRSRAWRVRLTGRPATRPLSDAGRLFFLTAQGVLMCLDKKGGSILWWATTSSRTAFDPAAAGEQVLVASLADRLASFNARDGREAGRFQAEGEFRANPVWAPPFILSHLSDSERRGEEELIFLRKQIQVALSASKPSPLRVNEEVLFTASVTGFRQPSYEFVLKSSEGEKVVQASSPRNSWSWFPEEEGAYTVVVRVSEGDEREESGLDVQVVRKG